MTDELRDDLMEIDGIAEKTADKILDVFDGHDSEPSGYLKKAFEAAERGEDRTAGVYLRRASKE